MQFSRTDELEILTVLHEGMHEQPPFGLFLSRVLRRVRADSVHLLLARGEAAIASSARANSRPTMRRRAVNDAADPIPYGSLRPERVYSFAEFPRPPDFAGRVVRTSAEDLDGWLVIRTEHEDFSARDSAFLSALAPHLAIALRNFAAVERERLQRWVGDWALERLGRGWMALTPTGLVIAADELAEKLLHDGGQLRRSPEKRLLAAAPAAHQRLMSAIEAVAARPDAGSRAVHISEAPRLELLIAPINTGRLGQPIIGSPVAAHIQAEPPADADPAAALGELFGLPPALARFACALARTGGIAESAEQLGLTIETGRFYSKTLYAKLGVNGQAELSRRILTSAAILA